MICGRSGRKPMWALLLCVVMSVWSAPASAHSMHQSAVLLDFHGRTVEAELQLPVDRLAISFRQTVDAQSLPTELPALTSYILSHVHPVMPDGRPFSVVVESMALQTVEGSPYLVVHLLLTPPRGATDDLFTLNYDVITHEIVTHVVLLSIRSDDRQPVEANDPVLIGYIRGPIKSVLVDRSRHL